MLPSVKIPYQGDRIKLQVPGQVGGKWYDAIWNGIKKVYNFAKDTKIASTAAAALGQPGIAAGLKVVGLGKPVRMVAGRKRKAKTMTGRKKPVIVAGGKASKSKESSVIRFS